jgi:hypothetical protein
MDVCIMRDVVILMMIISNLIRLNYLREIALDVVVEMVLNAIKQREKGA